MYLSFFVGYNFKVLFHISQDSREENHNDTSTVVHMHMHTKEIKPTNNNKQIAETYALQHENLR